MEMKIEAYNSHLEISNELAKFVDTLMQYNIDEQRIHQRTIYNRLYYAVYHKVLHENPNNDAIRNGTQAIHSHIKHHNTLSDFDKQLYNQLYTSRMWADYELTSRNIKRNHLMLLKNLLNKKIIVKSLNKGM